ncbi:uncharacterized protein PG986_001172 [Apiospora aurea]|uniref:Kelch repeat protein n=1 Tax=Apiospora aurea TaxID=335848 RepID=A0ABR1QW36_9PEZI
MVVGGEIAGPSDYDAKNDALMSLSNITFWDMGTETWHSQLATGDIPSPRSRACVVAAAAPGGRSYELFMYGGYDAAANKSMTDVYVLSIPGFVWFKTDIDIGAPRVGQACALMGKNSRQMAVVGGANSDLQYYPMFRDPDPWTNGINVLDLSELRWRSQYDPAAPAYEPPAMVKDWYNAGNQDKVGWISQDVMNLFKSDNSTSEPETLQSTSHTGAIVGGVVGGVVAVALAALVFFLVRRRRSKKQWEVAQQQEPTAAPEYTPAATTPAGAGANDYKYQPYAASSPGLYEASSPGIYEAPPSEPPTELQGQSYEPAATITSSQGQT